MSKSLIVYYSMDGNTQQIANKIQAMTNADIVRIDTVVPYEGTDKEISAHGKDEVERHYQPRIKPNIDIKSYETIYIGTPTWWYTMAPAMLTFLSTHDFTGKTIIPFQTSCGWTGQVIEDIKKECVGAQFKNEMSIEFSTETFGKMTTSKNILDNWLNQLTKMN